MLKTKWWKCKSNLPSNLLTVRPAGTTLHVRTNTTPGKNKFWAERCQKWHGNNHQAPRKILPKNKNQTPSQQWDMSKNVCPGWKSNLVGNVKISLTWSSWIPLPKCNPSKDISSPQLCKSLGDSVPNDQMTICRPRWRHKCSKGKYVNSNYGMSKWEAKHSIYFTFLRTL